MTSGSLLDALTVAARERASLLPASAPGPPPARPPSLAAAVAGRRTVSVIAEFKRRSPSAGAIREDEEPAERAVRYRDAGAAALSVLTEPTRFGGSLGDLSAAARASGLPALMKDFVVAPAQVRAGRDAGASAVLLIVRCLDDGQLRALYEEAMDDGLEALVEVHDAAELDRALALPNALIGINNRDLDTLAVDRRRAASLLPRVPADRIAVAESGYLEPEHLTELRGAADAVLIGAALMRAANPADFFRRASRPATVPAEAV